MQACELYKYILLLLLVVVVKKAFCESFCHKSKELESECASYCYEACKPLLQMAPECYRKDAEIIKLKDQLAELKKKLAVLEAKEMHSLSVAEIKAFFEKCTTPGQIKDVSTVSKLTTEKVPKEKQVSKITEVKQPEGKVVRSDGYPDNCEKSTGVQTIQVAGIPEPFQVFCDNRTSDFPWIVIQRRVNRAVDFNQNWKTYVKGFGDIEGSHFLGLEKIFRITNTQPYELYIYLESFGGAIRFARYSDFLISSESKYYQLLRLGKFTGNVFDAMSYHLYSYFSTYNNDNDLLYGENCAAKVGSGWWYKNCNISCNLNGRYADFEIDNAYGIWWKDFVRGHTLREVKMLIRPAH